MLSTLDFAVIALYLLGVTLFGIRAGGRQKSTADYFLGNRDLPWWAVCFSVVATETSTLTVIGIPAVAYTSTLTFLQITFGYLLGRLLVSIFFLPRYFRDKLSTAYAFLGDRYGDGMRATASVTFLFTRLLADGVRLFATAIPLKVITDAMGIEVGYFEIILVIGVATIAYTLIGGIRAVVWMDVVQMLVYVGGAVLAVVLLVGEVPGTWWSTAAREGKTLLFDVGRDTSFASWFAQPYVLFTAVVGGGMFSMASHGTDQLIVQRLLACRTVRDSQKALLASAFVVMFQFALFLLVGLLLWSYYGGASVADLGLTRPDEVFPKYIIEGLPPGLSGLILAGIVAAAMSTLSSSLNALASSSMLDLYERFSGRSLPERQALLTSRAFTFFWGIVFIGFAGIFEDQQNPVVELGLAIASFTYGGLLGAFLLGLLHRGTDQRDAVVAFVVALVVMVVASFGCWHHPEQGWMIIFPSEARIAEEGLQPIGWPWYPVIGSLVTLGIGSLLALRHRYAD